MHTIHLDTKLIPFKLFLVENSKIVFSEPTSTPSDSLLNGLVHSLAMKSLEVIEFHSRLLRRPGIEIEK